MAVTDAEMLVLVKDAIEAILTGKVSSYTVGNQSFHKLSLPDLMAMKRDLEAKVARASDPGRRVTEIVPL